MFKANVHCACIVCILPRFFQHSGWPPCFWCPYFFYTWSQILPTCYAISLSWGEPWSPIGTCMCVCVWWTMTTHFEPILWADAPTESTLTEWISSISESPTQLNFQINEVNVFYMHISFYCLYQLQKSVPNAKIGFSKAMSAGWLRIDKQAQGGPRVFRKVIIFL